MLVGELFAGIGGLAEGFKSAGLDIAWSNEFDRAACITYRSNHNHLLIEGDVKTIQPNQLAKIDILTGGFPCQAFSLAGFRKGFEDQRGELFFDVVRFLAGLKPRAFLLENVRGLVSHDNGKTFNVVLTELKKLGYTVIYKVLRTSDYSQAPQKRDRIFLIGFLNPYNAYNFTWPAPSQCKIAWWDLLDSSPDGWFILNKNSCMGRKIFKNIDQLEPRVFYSFSFGEAISFTDSLAPTLTTRWDRGGEALFMVDNENIRGFTINERLKLQGFRSSFIIPKEVSNRQAVKQLGNAVSPPVIELLAKEIKRVLEVDYTSYELVLR